MEGWAGWRVGVGGALVILVAVDLYVRLHPGGVSHAAALAEVTQQVEKTQSVSFTYDCPKRRPGADPVLTRWS